MTNKEKTAAFPGLSSGLKVIDHRLQPEKYKAGDHLADWQTFCEEQRDLLEIIRAPILEASDSRLDGLTVAGRQRVLELQDLFIQLSKKGAGERGSLPAFLNRVEAQLAEREANNLKRARKERELGRMKERLFINPQFQVTMVMRHLAGQVTSGELAAELGQPATAVLVGIRLRRVRELMFKLGPEEFGWETPEVLRTEDKIDPLVFWQDWCESLGSDWQTDLAEEMEEAKPSFGSGVDRRNQAKGLFLTCLQTEGFLWPAFLAEAERRFNRESLYAGVWKMNRAERFWLYLRNLAGQSREELSREYQVAQSTLSLVFRRAEEAVNSFSSTDLQPYLPLTQEEEAGDGSVLKRKGNGCLSATEGKMVYCIGQHVLEVALSEPGFFFLQTLISAGGKMAYTEGLFGQKMALERDLRRLGLSYMLRVQIERDSQGNLCQVASLVFPTSYQVDQLVRERKLRCPG